MEGRRHVAHVTDLVACVYVCDSRAVEETLAICVLFERAGF